MLYFDWLPSQHYESSDCPHPPYRQPSSFLYGSITFTHLEENSSMVKLPYFMLKSKGKPCMVKAPLHVKKISLNHVCKIGLKKGVKEEGAE
jgi:hypothetical protein